MGAIRVDDVSKLFRLYRNRPGSMKELVTKRRVKRFEEFWALRDVSLAIEPGHVHGLIGHNGCGKSTLLRLMAGIHAPTKGSVSTEGRVSALLELGAGFHPELTGRENVFLNASILGLSRRQTSAMFDRIVDFSGLSPFIDSPVKHYSSGMYVRLGFSVAVHVEPQILLVDEVIAVGDEEFQRRCLDHLASLKSDGVTIVFVTHAMGIVQNLCDSVTWIDHGRIREQGDPQDVVSGYLHEVNEAEEVARRSAGAGSNRNVRRRDVPSVELAGGAGAAGLLVAGEPFGIRIDWSTCDSSVPPRMQFVLETESGIHLSTLHFDPDAEAMTVASRAAEFRGYELPLGPGNYVLRPTVVEGRGSHVVAHLDEIPFAVRMGGSGIEGMFVLPGAWSPSGTSTSTSTDD